MNRVIAAEAIPPYPGLLWKSTLLTRQPGFMNILYVQRYSGPRQFHQVSEHLFWELTVVLKGDGMLHSDDRSISLKKNMLVLIPPGCPHREAAATMDTLWIGFRSDLMTKQINDPQCINDPVLARDAIQLWLLGERRFGPIGYEMDGMLLKLLGGVSRIHADSGSRAGIDPVDGAITWLHSHLADEIAFPQVAAALGISEGYFYRLFRKRTGMTPTRYLTRIRIERAVRMLRMSSARITDIAEACGFQDPYYFSRVFKQHTGKSPNRFRLEDRDE